MSHLTDLIAQTKANNPQMGEDLEREFEALSSRLPFGLNFERHRPEVVELPQRPVRKGDKVRILPERGSTKKGDPALWVVKSVAKVGGARQAALVPFGMPETRTPEKANFDDLVVVAEFRDTIYPGLKSTGSVSRGGDKPCHTVINGENYHVLKALTWTHRGKIDVIYIDPPYNTGAKDWKYNNDYVEGDDLYRHSKWLAMMERRLKIAKELLNPVDSVLMVTIDEKECLRLGLLLEQVFPEFTRQMVTIVNNPKGVTQGYLSRVDEYAFFCFSPGAKIFSVDDDLLSRDQRRDDGAVLRPRWKGLLRSGDEATRKDREKMFYPVWINPKTRKIMSVGDFLPLNETPELASKDGEGNVAAWPVRKDGTLGRWSVGSSTLKELIGDGLAAAGRFDSKRRTWGLSYLSEQLREELKEGKLHVIGRDAVTGVADVVFTSGASRRVRTVWHRTSHDAGVNGTDLVGSLVGAGRPFPFPKSLYAVEDALRISLKGKLDAVVLDFFAGSGTSAHAVIRLNHQDSGRRQCISVTNNEVGADEQTQLRKAGRRPGDTDWEALGICDYVTKPRVAAAITGKTPDGNPIKGDYRFTDEFPMAEGFAENAEFFTLTYESPLAVRYQTAFAHIAPLLWLRAGSRGRSIDKLPAEGWDVADAYGLLIDLDCATDFLKVVRKADDLHIAYIVTDDERRFQTLARRLPEGVEAVRLYESYLTNFGFANGDEA
ncbi:MAG: DNA methyltransferase [Dokdonella sp.]